MKTGRAPRAGRGLVWLAVLALALGVAACEEDDKEVEETAPPATMTGEGTIESPFVLQYGQSYTGIAMPQAGSVFFLAEGTPAGFSAIQTVSASDVDLAVFGFKTLFGSEGSGGSFTPGVGSESFLALGDGINTDLFFMVDGTHVRTNGATFDVTTLSSVAPAPVLLNMGPFLSTTYYVDEFGLVFAPEASLSVTMENTASQFMYLQAWASSNPPVWINTISNSGYGSGYCTVNFTAFPPFTGNTSSCQVHPIPNFDGLKYFTMFNANGTPGDLLIGLTSP